MARKEIPHITAADIERYGVVAAPDTLTGTPAQNKAVFDRLIRELVAAAYNLMADEVNLIMGSEETREDQETERATEETARKLAEELRAAAEELRAEAEASRVTAEAAREAAEEDRRAISAEIVKLAEEEADRARWEADRAGKIVGGDFVTHIEHTRDLSVKAPLAMVGGAEFLSELEPGGILFVTAGEEAAGYMVTLEDILREGKLAAENKENQLAGLLTVQSLRSLNLRADETGTYFTAAEVEALPERIRAMCLEVLAGGAYLMDGVITLSWKQVQGYLLDGVLLSETEAEAREFRWCYTRKGELEAIRQELAEIRALIGDLNRVLDLVNNNSLGMGSERE